MIQIYCVFCPFRFDYLVEREMQRKSADVGSMKIFEDLNFSPLFLIVIVFNAHVNHTHNLINYKDNCICFVLKYVCICVLCMCMFVSNVCTYVVCRHTCMSAYKYVYLYVYVCIYVGYGGIWTYINVYVWMHVCLHICIHIYKYI